MSLKRPFFWIVKNRHSKRGLFGNTGNLPSAHLAFGLIADVQYADKDDGTDFTQTKTRYYRGALTSLKHSVCKWKMSQLAFVVHLGDLIDGLNRHTQSSSTALYTALAPFKELACPTYHLVGNHELYNITRGEYYSSELNSGRFQPSAKEVKGTLYYSVEAHHGLKLVVLDSYDISVLGYDDSKDHPHYTEAVRILQHNNPNTDKHSADILEGDDRRFVAYNGGIGCQQLRWLEAELADSDSKQQNVLVCSHVQLYPAIKGRSDTGICLTWNYRHVLHVLHSHRCVVGCVSGHDHAGSQHVDEAGVHHLVLRGVVESRPGAGGRDCDAVMCLYGGALEVKGGAVRNVSMPLRYRVQN